MPAIDLELGGSTFRLTVNNLDITKKSGQENLERMSRQLAKGKNDATLLAFRRKYANFETFCKSLQKSLITAGASTQIFLDGLANALIVRSRQVFLAELPTTRPTPHSLLAAIDKTKKYAPSAMIVSALGLKVSSDYRMIPLVNGDLPGSESHLPMGNLNWGDECDEFVKKMPTCSFACLGRLVGGFNKAITQLDKGTLSIVDFTVDDWVNYTLEEGKIVDKSGVGALPPNYGFTAMTNGWHRSGFVLFHNEIDGKHYLLGQDEGTYFGVELPKPAKTIEEAVQSLVPEEVRGSKYQRQGEWFIVPVKENDVPPRHEWAVQFEATSYDRCVFLPLESPDSNRHYVCADEGVIAKDGRVYACCGELQHEEHKAVPWNGWATFYKSTAVRSVSQGGVD